jgi:hypothetical protein
MPFLPVRPHRRGWKGFEAPGIEPAFPEKDQAINYVQNRQLPSVIRILG